MKIATPSLAILCAGLTAAFFIGFLYPVEKISDDPNYIKTMPDFETYTDVNKKKEDFFNFLLPRVKAANNKIREERSWLLGLNPDNLSNDDQVRLTELADKYEVEDASNNSEIIEVLKRRIDVIPASLVLAQAANESAWGTSRFAKQGNNLFGQWCYVKGCGLVPMQRQTNERHEVAKYDDIQGSIESYMRNLNAQFSYADFRTKRAILRKNNKSISGIKLAEGLLKYSTRREAYVHEIQAMIKQNNLSRLDP